MASVEEMRTRQTIIRRLNPARDTRSADQAALRKAEETIAGLQREINDLRSQVIWGNRARDTLGAVLRKMFASPIWHWTLPLRWVRVLLGRARVGIDQLVPMTKMQRVEGAWEGSGLPQFLVPVLPTRGWLRIRAKIRSSVSTEACLYFDTGGGFHEGERFDLAPVGGLIEIDRLVPLLKTAYLIRFDPIRHSGKYSLLSFSLDPMSRIGANLLATWVNFKKMIAGTSGHRPSILVGLKILLSGRWRAFHHQLLINAGGETASSSYELWMKLHETTDADRQQMQSTLQGWKNPPTISVILPVYNVEERYLRHCIDSVISQIYPHWELCIADDASPKPHVKRVLSEYAERDPRIKVVYRSTNGNISAASNSALELATGPYIALLDHDDELADRALYRMAEAIVRDPSLDMLYSDEDKVAPHGSHSDPFFKPDWSPDYFLSCMYTCHLGVYRTELVRKVGGFRSEFDSAQDYDLVLRIIAQTSRIYHVPDVLYHWRSIASSTAAEREGKPESHQRAKKAIEQYLASIKRKAIVEDGPAAGCYLVNYEIIGRPRISIIIPSACQPKQNSDGEITWMVLQCVKGIRKVSTYDNIEILVLDHFDMPPALEAELEKLGAKRLSYDFDFNWARVNNFAASMATGEYLLFLNDDTQPITSDWLEQMLGYAQLPEIGAVGARLIYADGTLQHTGVCLPGGNPTHPYYRCSGLHPGNFYSNKVHRNWSSVTGACLMTRAEVFRAVGGFDIKFPLNYNDVAYGLQLLDRGFRIVYSPAAELYHFESKTRKAEVRADELEAIHEIWQKRYRWDPYYGPNLATDANDFRIAPMPLHPLNMPAKITDCETSTLIHNGSVDNSDIQHETLLATRERLSREYLTGDGIEIGALNQPLWTPTQARLKYVDCCDTAELRERHPELPSSELVEVDIIDEGETLCSITDESLDFIISDHLLEHCENPISTIRNHLRKLKPGGILYYAAADQPIPFDQLLQDDRLGNSFTIEELIENECETIAILRKNAGVTE
jgi:GT2 family glycosyltransferase